jgi:hypothetical protein
MCQTQDDLVHGCSLIGQKHGVYSTGNNHKLMSYKLQISSLVDMHTVNSSQPKYVDKGDIGVTNRSPVKGNNV